MKVNKIAQRKQLVKGLLDGSAVRGAAQDRCFFNLKFVLLRFKFNLFDVVSLYIKIHQEQLAIVAKKPAAGGAAGRDRAKRDAWNKMKDSLIGFKIENLQLKILQF